MEEKTKGEQKKEGKPASQANGVKISLIMLAVTAIFILALVFARYWR